MLKRYDYHNYYLCSKNVVVVFHPEFCSGSVAASADEELMARTAATLGANAVNLMLQMHQPHRMSKHITSTGAPRGIIQCSCDNEFVCS